MKTIRIGSGAGYAGDRLEPSLELIEKGNLDYISYECLAERTIAIGQQAKLKDPTKGYNGLLEHRMEKALPLCWKHKVKLITNMGSANPQAAAKKCVEIARKHGLTGMKIACVTGDDLLPVIDKYMDTEVWETHEPLSKLPGEIVSANAYMGVEGILKALEQGADVVITGRVADPAIFMAPAIHEFGWSLEDWDKLGKGTMMGHLLECGGQVTGGYFAEPGKKDVPGVGHLGFPIIEVSEDGSFFVTKVPEAGGMVTVETCSEQIVYEIHDPENYLTPDVVADFKQVKFTEVEKDKVQVEGATGKPKTDTFKCSIGYKDCFIGDGEISYGGPRLPGARQAGSGYPEGAAGAGGPRPVRRAEVRPDRLQQPVLEPGLQIQPGAQRGSRPGGRPRQDQGRRRPGAQRGGGPVHQRPRRRLRRRQAHPRHRLRGLHPGGSQRCQARGRAV